MCKPKKGRKEWQSLDEVVKFSDHFFGHPARMTIILINSNDWIVWSVVHNLRTFLVYKTLQFYRFTEFRHFLHVIEK